jgi:hypothetical protein
MFELVFVLPCFLCGHESDMNVIVEGRDEPVCSVCFEKADESDEPDEEFDREGQPEFNGAFDG